MQLHLQTAGARRGAGQSCVRERGGSGRVLAVFDDREPAGRQELATKIVGACAACCSAAPSAAAGAQSGCAARGHACTPRRTASSAAWRLAWGAGTLCASVQGRSLRESSSRELMAEFFPAGLRCEVASPVCVGAPWPAFSPENILLSFVTTCGAHWLPRGCQGRHQAGG